MKVVRYEINTKGRDFAVGDIHGDFSHLQKTLDILKFNPDVDRLFSVGDLVDRGQECDLVLDWLNKPWFHAVRGNHDEMAIMCSRDGIDRHLYHVNGGDWFLSKTKHEQKSIAQVLDTLPIVIEVETPSGIVGIVHADCTYPDWGSLTDALSRLSSNSMDSIFSQMLVDSCLWSRQRIENEDASGVSGVHAVICGHTTVKMPVTLGNVHFIDTGGWRNRFFTLLDLHTLRPEFAVSG